MVLTYLLPIFGKDTFLAKHIPKSGLSKIPNLGHFPLLPNHTLYTSSASGPTSLPYWDVEGKSLDLTLLTCLATFVFCLDFGFFLHHTFSSAAIFIISITRDKFGFFSSFIRMLWALWACCPLLGQKGLDPICFNLSKSFYRKSVLYRRFVFCYKSLSFAFLSQPKYKSRLLFLFGFFGLLSGWGLLFYWAFHLMSF